MILLIYYHLAKFIIITGVVIVKMTQADLGPYLFFSFFDRYSKQKGTEGILSKWKGDSSIDDEDSEKKVSESVKEYEIRDEKLSFKSDDMRIQGREGYENAIWKCNRVKELDQKIVTKTC